MGEARVYSEEMPIVEACVNTLTLSRYEITNAQFATFVAETGYITRAERGWSEDETEGPGEPVSPGSVVFIPPKRISQALDWWQFVEGASWHNPTGRASLRLSAAHLPVVHVTRADAEAYADWAGGRLPGEAEWEYAARGGISGSLYAWEETEATRRSSRANTWQGVFPVINTNEDGHIGLAPIGSFPPNPFGLHDMIGNVWEWTNSIYYPTHMPDTATREWDNGFDPKQPGIKVGVIKGGSHLCAKSYCYRYRPAARHSQDLTFGTSHIGFRIAKDISSTPPN